MLVLLGESASGKTEIAKYLAKNFNMKKVITATTRPPRENEKGGVDYFFYTEEEFLKKLHHGEFLEYVNYRGHYYGTLRSEIGPNKCVILEPKGVKSLQKMANSSIIVFYLKASEEKRIERMRHRNEKEEEIKSRVKEDRVRFAKENMPHLDFVIPSDNRDVPLIAKEIEDKYRIALTERGMNP